jgi:hypothetical protein
MSDPLPPPTQVVHDVEEKPKELSLILELVIEFIKDLPPDQLRQLAGDLIQTPERLEMQQLAQNQIEINQMQDDLSALTTDVRAITSWVKKYGTLTIGALIGSDVLFKLAELFM